MFARHEPSLTSKKLNPPFESRRVRIQPCTVTVLPTASDLRAAKTVILSIVRTSMTLWHDCVRFDFDLGVGIDESCDFHDCRGWSDILEQAAVYAGDFFPFTHVGDVHSRADNVL